MTEFETENAVYKELSTDLLEKHEGKYAVIKGKRFLGVFDSNDEGYSAGLEAFGIVPFLLRHITRTPRMIRMSGLQVSRHHAEP